MKPSMRPWVWAPDLRAGAADVGFPVRGVVELVGPDRPGCLRRIKFCRQATRNSDVIHFIGIGSRIHLDQRGAEEPNGVLFLLALVARDNDGATVAQSLGDHGQADSGVARGPLDDPAPGAEQALGFGVAHHVERRAVLYRLPGVHEFGLAENLAAGRVADVIQPDQGRVADGVEDALRNRHKRYLRGLAAKQKSCLQALARDNWTTWVRSGREPACRWIPSPHGHRQDLSVRIAQARVGRRAIDTAPRPRRMRGAGGIETCEGPRRAPLSHRSLEPRGASWPS